MPILKATSLLSFTIKVKWLADQRRKFNDKIRGSQLYQINLVNKAETCSCIAFQHNNNSNFRNIQREIFLYFSP